MSGMVFICEMSLVMLILPTLRHFIALCRPDSVASRELFGLDALPDRVIRTWESRKLLLTTSLNVVD